MPDLNAHFGKQKSAKNANMQNLPIPQEYSQFNVNVDVLLSSCFYAHIVYVAESKLYIEV